MKSIQLAPLLVVCMLSSSGATAHAGVVHWTIDSTQSSIKLTIPDSKLNIPRFGVQTLRVRNQNSQAPWVLGSTASLAGMLQTNYTENELGRNIQFLENPLGQLVGLNSGNYRPNPATFEPANTSEDNPAGQFTGVTTAPGSFAAQVYTTIEIGIFRFAYFNLHGLSYDARSQSLPLSGNSFNTGGISFGISQGTLAVDGVTTAFGQPVPDSLSAFPPFLAQNATSVGTITDVDELTRKLTLPISVPFTLDLGGGFVLPGTMSGQIVAFALVPEPSTLVLAATAMGVFATAACRRLRRSTGKAGG